jgi:hypothetical protein
MEMTNSDQHHEPTGEKFASPSALRQFAIETATLLRQTGLNEAGDILEAAANFAATTGWEWLGELGIATKTIQKRTDLPDSLRSRISRIAQAAASRQPYG